MTEVNPPKFSKGQLVRVLDYYDDLIPKGSYEGLIVSLRKIPLINSDVIIYEILVLEGMNEGQIESAEEFAVHPLVQGIHL